MNKKVWLGIMVLMIVTLFVACASPTPTTTSTATSGEPSTDAQTPEKNSIQLGISFPGMQDAAWVSMKNNLEKYASEASLKVDLIFTAADQDIAKQASDIKDLISKECDVILIFPIDSKTISASIKDCNDAGIPAMTYCRSVSPDAEYQADVFVGIDAEYQGYSSTKETLQRMIDKNVTPTGLINVSGDLRDENSRLRTVGIQKACDEFGVKYLQDAVGNWDPQQAADALAAALKAYPEANVVAINSDCMLSGVITSLEAAGRWVPEGEENHMYIASCDVFPAAIPYIRDGYISADTLYDVVGMSKKAIEVAIELANGKEFSEDVMIQGPVYTPENVDDPELVEQLWS